MSGSGLASSIPSAFTEREEAALVWAKEEKEREPLKVFSVFDLFLLWNNFSRPHRRPGVVLSHKLSLWTRRWSFEKCRWVDHPGKSHVEVLWRMNKAKRERFWELLGPFCALDTLELGGDVKCDCPLDDAELEALPLPEHLQGVRCLHLGDIGRLTDNAVHALARAGCGDSLMELYLCSASTFFL